MFKFLTQHFSDMGNLTKLFNEAERLANTEGQAEPGAEHLVMAALTMPHDESGRRALARLGATPDAFWQAVGQQYTDALKSIGIAPLPADSDQVTAPRSNTGLYKATESMKDLMDAVTSSKEFMRRKGFSAAEIILGATRPQFGVVARAFILLGIDREALAAAAREEISQRASG